MVIVADKNGTVDSAYHSLVKHIKSDLPIVMISWVENFKFNEQLLQLKEWICVCFCEYGWNYDIIDSHIWGVNTNKGGYGDGRYRGEEWDKLDNWVRGNQPKLMFKRELLKKDVSDRVRPIEYPCLIPEWPMQLSDEFNSRPLDFFQYWGRSNENRIRIHGELWLDSYKNGYQICDNIYYIQEYLKQEHGKRAISLWIPHWARVDINNLMPVNGISKMSLSWKGAGFKCFRTAEAPVNSVMVMEKNDYAWTFDWNDTNCVLVERDNEISGINKALENKSLYEIYLKGMSNCDKYRIKNYVPYLEKKINEVIS